MPLYLTPSSTYDRAAILRAAWIKARHEVVASANPCFPFPALPITLRAAFADALRHVWSLARAERCYALWAAKQDAHAAAEAARRAALPVPTRAIEDARTALFFAEHNDTHAGHRLVAEARARLRSLELTA